MRRQKLKAAVLVLAARAALFPARALAYLGEQVVWGPNPVGLSLCGLTAGLLVWGALAAVRAFLGDGKGPGKPK